MILPSPCPFCGEDPLVAQCDTEITVSCDCDAFLWFPYCAYTVETSKDDALRAWNAHVHTIQTLLACFPPCPCGDAPLIEEREEEDSAGIQVSCRGCGCLAMFHWTPGVPLTQEIVLSLFPPLARLWEQALTAAL